MPRLPSTLKPAEPEPIIRVVWERVTLELNLALRAAVFLLAALLIAVWVPTGVIAAGAPSFAPKPSKGSPETASPAEVLALLNLLADPKVQASRHLALLARLRITPGQVEQQAIDLARGNPIKMLFGEGYALQTVLLWIVLFCSLVNLYLFVFWLPEILHLTGLTPPEAVFATSLHALGAIAAVLYLGVLIDRFRPERALALHYAASIVFIALLALVAMPYGVLLTMVFLSGMTVVGSQTGANATAGALYPARMRTSGIGWALGIGRLGGIAAAPLGGFLLARGLAPRHVFLSACFFAVVAAVGTALLALGGRRAAEASDRPAPTDPSRA